MIESGYERDAIRMSEPDMAAGSVHGDGPSNVMKTPMSSTSAHSAGDPLPANCELIEVHVSELKQLFNAIDPSPFRERDLDPNAEEFIADWAKEASPSATLGLTTTSKVIVATLAGLLDASAGIAPGVGSAGEWISMPFTSGDRPPTSGTGDPFRVVLPAT